MKEQAKINPDSGATLPTAKANVRATLTGGCQTGTKGVKVAPVKVVVINGPFVK